MKPDAVCTKGYDALTWIIRTSVGGHCDGGPYTSVYACANKCIWSPEALSTSRCSDISFQHYNATNVCMNHMPCVPNQPDPQAPDGPCFCCTFDLAPATTTNGSEVVILESSQKRISAARFWMLFLAQLTFMGWVLVLIHFQLKVVQVQGVQVVGPSDFSVWISGINPASAINSALKKCCQHFGPIMAGFVIPSVGEAIRVGRRVEQIQICKEEADADPGDRSWNLLRFIYRKFIVGSPKRLSQLLEKKQMKLKIYERQETIPTRYGVATFRYADAAADCVETYDTSPIGSIFEKLTCGLTSTKPLLHGSTVSVVRAPEPSDIIWEHTECSLYEIWRRRIISWMITICVMCAGAGVQYGLASLAEKFREDRYFAEMAAGNGEEWAVQDADRKTARIRAITIVTGVMVVVINFSTMLTVRALAWYERWTTRTSMERWVMLKLSVSQLMNAFAAPLLAAYASGNTTGWYVRGGLMEAAFFVQCANAILPPAVHFLGIGDNFKYFLLSPFARTQVRIKPFLDDNTTFG